MGWDGEERCVPPSPAPFMQKRKTGNGVSTLGHHCLNVGCSEGVGVCCCEEQLSHPLAVSSGANLMAEVLHLFPNFSSTPSGSVPAPAPQHTTQLSLGSKTVCLTLLYQE